MNNIAVVIVAINEEKWIERCILSAKQVTDEIVVVIDDRTTDKTQEIAKKLGAKTFITKFVGFSETKNFANSKTSAEWIFSLDADERISSELAKEIIQVISSESSIDTYSCPRQNIMLGQIMKHGGWWPDEVTRLAKKDSLNGWTGNLHEVLESKGKKGKLSNPLVHLTHRGISWMLELSISYTALEAKNRFLANHPKIAVWRLFRVMFTEFWYRMVIKSGWKDGFIGWVEGISQAYNMFLVYVQLWELQQEETMEEKYLKIDKDLLK